MKKRKVRIISMPKAQSGLEIRMNPGMGFNANQLKWPRLAGEFNAPEIEANHTVGPDRNNPNIEAEGGETIVDDRDRDGLAEHYKITGPRHSEGGVDLHAGPNAFVFSDTKAMKIKDPTVLKDFNKTVKAGGITPADIAKQYDINEFLKTLKDPDTDDLQRKTAEAMVNNYNLKLGKLALVQESKKGFEGGMPKISESYMQSIGMDPGMFNQTQAEPTQPAGNMAKYGGSGFGLPKAQTGNLGSLKNQLLLKEEQRKAAEEAKRLSTPIGPGILNKLTNAGFQSIKPIAQWYTDPTQTRSELEALYARALNDPRGLEGTAEAKREGEIITFAEKIKDLENKENKKNQQQKALEAFYEAQDKSMVPKLPYQAKERVPLLPYKKDGKKHYATRAEYEQDLLSQYSPEKRNAQIEFLHNNPFIGVQADVTQVPLTDTTVNFQDPSTAEWFNSLSQDQKNAWYKEAEKRHNVIVKQQYGGGLPKAQLGAFMAGPKKPGQSQSTGRTVTPGETYNVYDEAAMKEADRLGYHYIHPSEDFRYAEENVGSQRPSQNPKDWSYDTESGFISPSGKPFGEKGLQDFISRWGDVIEKYPGGKEAWVKDLKAGKTSNTNKAMRYLLPIANKEHMAITGKPIVNEKQAGAYIPGTKLFSLPRLGKNQPKTPAPTETAGPENVYAPTVRHLEGTTNVRPRADWWAQDMNNMTNAALDYYGIPQLPPSRFDAGMQEAAPTFFNPNRQVAAINEGVNAQNRMMATFAGPQGLARSNASAQGARQVADIIGDYDNRNVGVANQFEEFNTGIRNQDAMNRAANAKRFADEQNTYKENLWAEQKGARNEWGRTANQAITNRANTYNLNLTNPYYQVSPGSGGMIGRTNVQMPLTPEYDDPNALAQKFAEYKKMMSGSDVSDNEIWGHVFGTRGKQQNFANQGVNAGNYGNYGT